MARSALSRRKTLGKAHMSLATPERELPMRRTTSDILPSRAKTVLPPRSGKLAESAIILDEISQAETRPSTTERSYRTLNSPSKDPVNSTPSDDLQKSMSRNRLRDSKTDMSNRFRLDSGGSNPFRLDSGGSNLLEMVPSDCSNGSDEATSDGLDQMDDACCRQPQSSGNRKDSSNDIALRASKTPESGELLFECPKAARQLKESDILPFLTDPAPQGAGGGCRMQECQVHRKGNGKYELFVELATSLQFLACARKISHAPSRYTITLDREAKAKEASKTYLAKIKSNFLGTEYIIFDNGDKRVRGGATQRHQIACVTYEPNFLGANGQRKMHAALPKIADGETKSRWRARWDFDDESLLINLKANNGADLIPLKSKGAQYSEKTQGYVLNFGDRPARKIKGSHRNFQLVEKGGDGEDVVLIQFAKISQDAFLLDWRYPMCGLQAFAIAVTAFDFKLACD